MYLTVTPSKNDGNTIYKLTAKDVPVGGLWSVSMYNVKATSRRTNTNVPDSVAEKSDCVCMETE